VTAKQGIKKAETYKTPKGKESHYGKRGPYRSQKTAKDQNSFFFKGIKTSEQPVVTKTRLEVSKRRKSTDTWFEK